MYNSAKYIFLEGRMKKLLLISLLAVIGFQVQAAGDIEKGKLTS